MDDLGVPPFMETPIYHNSSQIILGREISEKSPRIDFLRTSSTPPLRGGLRGAKKTDGGPRKKKRSDFMGFNADFHGIHIGLTWD